MKKKQVSGVGGKEKESKKVQKPNRIYFSTKTEDAIVLYNTTTDIDERERIFRESIQYPFDKLAENIINRFKFPYVNQSFEDLKRQVVSFLVINLGKYTKEKGKAFSYFSVIAKNYLILHNNNGYKQEKRSVYLSDKTESDIGIEEVLLVEDIESEKEEMKEFIALMVEYWENNISRIFKKRRDIEIASAIIELFKNAENIENFNKKSLYLLIREMTNCKTSYITKVVNKMRKQIMQHLNEYRERGVISTGESKYFKYNRKAR